MVLGKSRKSRRCLDSRNEGSLPPILPRILPLIFLISEIKENQGQNVRQDRRAAAFISCHAILPLISFFGINLDSGLDSAYRLFLDSAFDYFGIKKIKRRFCPPPFLDFIASWCGVWKSKKKSCSCPKDVATPPPIQAVSPPPIRFQQLPRGGEGDAQRRRSHPARVGYVRIVSSI